MTLIDPRSTGWRLSRSRHTHTVEITCAEAECPDWINGFISTIDETTALGKQQAQYLRAHRKEAVESRNAAGLTVFTFPPGSKCFKQHHRDLEREPFYMIRGGRYGSTQQVSSDEWIDRNQTVVENVRRIRNG